MVEQVSIIAAASQLQLALLELEGECDQDRYRLLRMGSSHGGRGPCNIGTSVPCNAPLNKSQGPRNEKLCTGTGYVQPSLLLHI